MSSMTVSVRGTITPRATIVSKDKTPSIMARIEEAERELGGNGRVLVRESGTEPLLRVMLEGKDKDMVTRLTNVIADEVRAALC